MTDSQTLLAEYARNGSDAAFRELVTRFVDLVYSTALRLVEGDTHRAEDVTQTVFVNLSRKARTLPADVRLGGWLHRDACLVAGHTLRGERRRQSRDRQAAEMNALQNHSAADFSQVAPLLDEAINELGEADRTAILLRFFEQQDFRAVGQALGSNEDAARMRVTRALEKLEEFLKRRGVTTTAASLGVVLTANAVQAAPVGLAVTISTAAALAGTTLAATSTAAATKAIAMTTLQKTIFGITLAASIGTAIYEARQASTLRHQVQTLQQQQASIAEQIRQLQSERNDATNRLVALRDDNERLNRNTGELLKLRGEVGLLRRQQTSQQDQQLEQEKTESEWIKSIVYFGDDDQIKLWRSRGPNGILMLVRALKSSAYDHSTRMCVASLISQLGNYAKSAISELISLIKTEKDESVRGLLIGYFEGPIEGLGETEKAEMFPELIRALQSSDSSVRNNALVLLQSYPNQSDTLIPLLVKSLQDSSPGVRLMAVKALEKVDPQNSAGVEQVAVVLGCLNGPAGDTPGSANDAAIMLGKLHREPDLVVPALIQSLQSSDRHVRQNSAIALGRFGEQAKPAITALTKALEDSDSDVRRRAAAAIANINSAPPAK